MDWSTEISRAENENYGMGYSNEFKRLVIYKLLSQPGVPIRDLARDAGVAKSTIWDWKEEVVHAQTTMGEKNNQVDKAFEPRVTKKRKPDEKFRIVVAAQGLSEEELGALLRREGVHVEELEQWCDAMLASVETPQERVRERGKVRTLERQVYRQDKALKEAHALLKLQKKVQAIWGDEDDDTNRKSD